MRILPRRWRKLMLVVAGIIGLVTGLLLGLGPVARARVEREAARRRLDVHIGSVRVGWFSVRLGDVVARPAGVTGIETRVTEVQLKLSAGLKVSSVELHGGEVKVTGGTQALREQLGAWREQTGRSEGGRASTLAISADAFSVTWSEGVQTHAQAHGLGFVRDERGLRLSASDASFHGSAPQQEALDVTALAIELNPQGDLVRAHAGSAVVGWAPGTVDMAGPEQASATEAVVAVKPGNAHTQTSAPVSTPSADDPLVSLPDTHALRTRAHGLARLLDLRMPEGAEVSVDAMTWKIGRDGDRSSVTVGPGPARLARTSSHFEARYSTTTHAPSAAFSVTALLPTSEDNGDVSVTVEGGPVSLALLGIKEGAAGLVDVDRATVTGRAHVALAGDGSALTVDAELGTRGLSVRQARLAADVLRDIELDLRLRGVLSDSGELRLDDFAGTWGAAHIAGSGVLDQKPDYVAAALRFELPSAPCQSLLESIPTALLPALQGTKMVGTFGARGRFAFDSRSLDDLELHYEVQDQCRVVEVPVTLARQRFKQPFAHRIYLPDGSTAEQTTGPGTSNWTPLDRISPFMQVAVLTTEDAGFSHHRGFDRPAIRAAIIANLEARRFVRGASTITMQLAKNLFLARDKTLARKLQEVVLTDYLEQTFSKDEIMELYLNVIEFGPAVYGITAAAEFYFGRSPADLNLAECLFLATLLPSPVRYGAMREAAQVPDAWLRSVRNLMRIANERGLVTDSELAEAEAEPIVFWHGGQRPAPRPIVRVGSRLGGDDTEAAPVLPVRPDMP